MSTLLHQLISHEHWANHRLSDALQDNALMDEKVVRLFNHILAAHATWYGRITGAVPEMKIWDDPTSPAHWGSLIDAHYSGWKKVLSFDNPTRQVQYSNSHGARFTNTVEEILIHLSLHGQYHRGQVVQYCRAGWEFAPSTDLIVFLRESTPAL